MLDKRKFYIDGKWVDPVKKNDFEVINPCNEDPFAIISSILVVYFEGNLFSVAFRIGIASATAYALGMTIDIFAFQAIREKYSSWWIAPSLSTVISNVIDSYVFFFTAFYSSENIYMSNNWIEIATTQTIIKIIIGLILFLPAYGILLNFLLKYSKKKG